MAQKLDSMALLAIAQEDLDIAKTQLDLAVIYAVKDGWNNVQIADALGVTESSVRRTRKRLVI